MRARWLRFTTTARLRSASYSAATLEYASTTGCPAESTRASVTASIYRRAGMAELDPRIGNPASEFFEFTRIDFALLELQRAKPPDCTKCYSFKFEEFGCGVDPNLTP